VGRCNKHGILIWGTNNCEQCDNQPENTKKKQGQILMRKQVTLLERPIGTCDSTVEEPLQRHAAVDF
jgi:hypothetical protein